MTFYNDFPDDSEWTRPVEKRRDPSFMQKLGNVLVEEVGSVYRRNSVVKKRSALVRDQSNDVVPIPRSGVYDNRWRR
jgi:hypothetical protein